MPFRPTVYDIHALRIRYDQGLRMIIRIEFYGIPRRRAGVAETTIEFEERETTLGDVLKRLAARYPDLSGDCIDGDRLHDSVAASLDGRQFLDDPGTHLVNGDSVLLLSGDGGG
jgi:molybdopterin converting factor small subunit